MIKIKAPASALTQQQKITPPIAVYWMSINTTSGLPMDGMLVWCVKQIATY